MYLHTYIFYGPAIFVTRIHSMHLNRRKARPSSQLYEAGLQALSRHIVTNHFGDIDSE